MYVKREGVRECVNRLEWLEGESDSEKVEMVRVKVIKRLREE